MVLAHMVLPLVVSPQVVPAEVNSAVRTCSGCSGKAEKKSLLRFVISREGELIADPLALMPGRGVYTHYSCECLLRKGMPNLMRSRLERQAVRKDKKGVVFTIEVLLSILERARQNITPNIALNGTPSQLGSQYLGASGKRKDALDSLDRLVELLRGKKPEGMNELNGGHRRKIRF